MVLQLHVGGAYVLFGRFSNTFASEGSPIFLPTLRYCIFKNNKFCFGNDVFLIHGLGKCEGVGEDSGHGFVI